MVCVRHSASVTQLKWLETGSSEGAELRAHVPGSRGVLTLEARTQMESFSMCSGVSVCLLNS